MKSTLVHILSALFILVFIYASVSKLMDIEAYRSQIGQARILSSHKNYLSVFIPSAEIIISFAIAADRLRLIGLYSFYFLMTLFSFYILWVLFYSENVPCSCGGILERMTWTGHLAFNILFSLGAFFAILLHSPSSHKSRVIGENA
jgi:hypothetical protein